MSNPLRLDYEVRRVSGLPVLGVTGEIDIYTAPLFKQAVVNLVSEGNRDVIIDYWNGAIDFDDLERRIGHDTNTLLRRLASSRPYLQTAMAES